MRLLQTYHDKRDFEATPEPRGEVRTSAESLMFVVQKHDATSLHYDFRLEIDGVLKSWSIPKGPSLNPADKRLAMQTEDHPVDYANFEGWIPKGHYGAGEVIVWDTGEYVPQDLKLRLIPPEQANEEASKQHAAGQLKFELRGHKLRGSWALVKMKGRGEKSWLLIKHDDEAADREYPIIAQVESVLSGRILERDETHEKVKR